MRSELIEAIRTGDPEIMQLFAQPFDHHSKWIQYIDENFGSQGNPTVNHILNRKEQWHSKRFQALYIACWIYHPVEKGSYMIQLTDQQLSNAEASAEKLTWRKSSHLSGTSRSARGGTDFEFIKGYGELLVIVEGKFLFLKMEGHKASSPSHLKSWVTKIRTGAGEMSNADLNSLATTKPQYGITARAAENYSLPYKALLKELGFSGTTTTFIQVVNALHQKFPSVPFPVIDGGPALEGFLRSLYGSSAVTASAVGKALVAARSDIDTIIRDLKSNEHRMKSDGESAWGIDQVFNEIRLSPERIDRKLQKFYDAVQRGDFPSVKRINNS